MDYHWVYFIPDDISINRLVEFKNLNQRKVPSNTTVICAEVTQISSNVITKVTKDLVNVGLIKESQILDSKVVSEAFGYPVYEIGIEDKVQKAKENMQKYESLLLLGRSAEFIHREVDDIFRQAKHVAESITKQVTTKPTESKREGY